MIVESCTVCHHEHEQVCSCGCDWKGREKVFIRTALDMADTGNLWQKIKQYWRNR